MIGISAVFQNENFGWVIAVVMAFALCAVLLRSYLNRLDVRRENVRVAKMALESHYRAVGEVLDDPTPSKDLKLSLCNFSEMVTDREFGIFLAEFLSNEEFDEARLSAHARRLHEERNQLAKTYPHLRSAFGVAVESGVAASLLRWPDTSGAFKVAVVRINADDRRDSQILAASGDTYIRRDLIPA
jgi:hypothetical protein